jgi:hypothetical protein
MGQFFAASAFRTEDVEALEGAVGAYCGSYGVHCDVRRYAASPTGTADAAVYRPRNGWACVLWPTDFNLHDFSLCEQLSRETALAASSIHVYHGEFWQHVFFDGGRLVHKFSSWPDYFAVQRWEAEKARVAWRGDPKPLAELFGIPADAVAGYLVHTPAGARVGKAAGPGLLRWFHRKPEVPLSPKAYPTDRHDLADPWVFTDFWAKLGITYPEPLDEAIAAVLRLDRDFTTKLPVNPEG